MKSFEKLFGKPVIYNESYLASEGYIAYQSRLDRKIMQLVVDNGLFYEFVPFNDDNFDGEGDMVDNPEAKKKRLELLSIVLSNAKRLIEIKQGKGETQ